jgi:uncharacterized protein YsxB (DUF464 family)
LFWGEEGLLGLESRGHSDEEKCEGEDVVCAAVSAVVHVLLVGLRDVAGMPDADCEIDKAVPLIRVTWPREKASKLDLLTRTVAFSLKEIASRYGEDVSISEVYRS